MTKKQEKEFDKLFRTGFNNSVHLLTKEWQKKGAFYSFYSSKLERELKAFINKISNEKG